MEKQLRLLESFPVHGDDGNNYQVRVYEHLARLDAVPGLTDEWESTGLAEYKLADGRHVEVSRDGGLTLHHGGQGSGIRLTRAALQAGAA
jgi:hypothetical protein